MIANAYAIHIPSLTSSVVEYCQELSRLGTIVYNLTDVRGVVRDPTDDMIIACAIAAGADYIVTRDKDLLSLGEYEGIGTIKPEAFLHVLRGERSA
jgi:predicted nucleic acid-binding protein